MKVLIPKTAFYRLHPVVGINANFLKNPGQPEHERSDRHNRQQIKQLSRA